jgi:hypothetical protein
VSANWSGWLRTLGPKATGFIAAGVAVWATKKGIPLTETEAATMVGALGSVLATAIDSRVNRNGAAHPDMVKQAPDAPYAGATDDPFAPGEYTPPLIVPIPIGDQPSPYAPRNPVIAENAALAREINEKAKRVIDSSHFSPRPPIQPELAQRPPEARPVAVTEKAGQEAEEAARAPEEERALGRGAASPCHRHHRHARPRVRAAQGQPALRARR